MDELSKKIVPKGWLADESTYEFWRLKAEGLGQWDISLLSAGLNPFHLYSHILRNGAYLKDEVPEDIFDEVFARHELAHDVFYKVNTQCIGRPRLVSEWASEFRRLGIIELFPACYLLDPIDVGPKEADDSLPYRKETPLKDADDSTRHREQTLLKVIAVMAIEKYGYEPGAPRQSKALSQNRGGIPHDCEKRGVPVSGDTLRSILLKAVELLPKSGS